jgi:hypothetical protein
MRFEMCRVDRVGVVLVVPVYYQRSGLHRDIKSVAERVIMGGEAGAAEDIGSIGGRCP